MNFVDGPIVELVLNQGHGLTHPLRRLPLSREPEPRAQTQPSRD
jgi:hypothetical protein